MRRRVIVLGAGISGLSVAWKLSAAGIPVEILEASNLVGGLAGTVRQDGYCLDYGPHSFFSEDQEISETVHGFFGGSLMPSERSVKLFYKGRYLDYPLTAANVLFGMGLGSGVHAALSYFKGKLFARGRELGGGEERTVEEWAKSNFGDHLYRSFFQPYTEQFWLTPCSQLSSRSIPSHTQLSFTKTVTSLVQKRLNGKEPSLLDREKLPTYYPKTGYGEIAERLAGQVTQAGGVIHLDCRAARIDRIEEGRFLVSFLRSGKMEQVEASAVVSTIPLPLFVGMLNPAPAQEVLEAATQLDYRPLLVLGMVTERENLLGASYLYMLDRPYNRITEMNKFSPATSPPGENILAVEIPCHRDDAVWNASPEALFDRCIGSLEKDQFLTREEVKKLLVVRAPYAYPVYRSGYAKPLKLVLDTLQKSPGIHTLGRTGEFMYMDADRCMRRAFNLADRLQQCAVPLARAPW